MSSLPPISSGGTPASSRNKVLKKRKEYSDSSSKKPTQKRPYSKAVPPKKRTALPLLIPIQPKAEPWYQPLQAMLRPILAQTTYGKNLERLLSPEQHFSAVSLSEDTLCLRNYNTIRPTDRPPFKGVCNELALNMAHYLKQQFGPTLTIQMLKGTCQDYYPNGIHYYLIMWPPTQDDAMNRQLRISQNLPESALVVDPSFQRTFCPQDNPQENQKYKQQLSCPLEGNFLQNISPNINLNDLPVLLPVGFLKDLRPELTASYGQQALLYLEYDKPSMDGLPPRITPTIQRNANSMEFEPALDCLSQIRPEHPLNQLYNRLISDLTPSLLSSSESNSPSSEEHPFELALDIDFIIKEWQAYHQSIPTQPLSPINPFHVGLSTPTGTASDETEQQTGSESGTLTVSPFTSQTQPVLLPSISFLINSPQSETALTSLPPLPPWPFPLGDESAMGASRQTEDVSNHLPFLPTGMTPLHRFFFFPIDPRQSESPEPPVFQAQPISPETPVEPLT